MILKNADLFGKRVNIEINDGKITRVSEENLGDGLDLCGKTVIPGLIDVHTHGMFGIDTMDADFSELSMLYAKQGTTSYLPTTMTMDLESLEKVDKAKTDYKGANILGFHFEGPYISKKYKGAQNEAYIRKPDFDEFSKFENVRMVTVAPETEGAEDFIKKASEKMVVSIGHTDCDYETALKAIDAGANCLTHTFNAMPPFLHRAPGPIGAATEKQIYAQLICDGFHVLRPMVKAAIKMFGADRIVMISDSIRCAKLPDGEYESGGLKVILKDNAAKLSDGTVAGSISSLLDCVKKAVEFGIDFKDAVNMASKNPAEMLGIKKGEIKEGYDADLLILDEKMNLQTVIIGGETI